MRYSKQRKQATRRRILDSARRLFAAKGFAATSMDEIMQACALTRGEEPILTSAAMIVGALAIARTSEEVQLNEALFDACRRGAETLLEHADELARPAFFWTPVPRATTAA